MREILREGRLFLSVSGCFLAVFLLLFFALGNGLFLIPSFLGLFVFGYTIFFLRIPRRDVKQDPDVIYASADGYVFGIEENIKAPAYIDEPCNKVVIFMHVASVHWNLAPIEGKIEYEKYNPGAFKNVFKESAWNINEHQLFGINNETTKTKVLVSMIAGLIARRIRFLKKTGDTLNQGERFGLIKYGSANMLFFPTQYEIVAQKGQKTRAGLTIIARKKK